MSFNPNVLEASFEKLQTAEPQWALQFYHLFLQNHPPYLDWYSAPQIKSQSKAFELSFQNLLTMPERFEMEAKKMAYRFHAYGFSLESLRTLGDSFLKTVESILGPRQAQLYDAHWRGFWDKLIIDFEKNFEQAKQAA